MHADGDEEMPTPPFPRPDDPLFLYTLHEAQRVFRETGSADRAIVHGVVNAWMEGYVAATGGKARPGGPLPDNWYGEMLFHLPQRARLTVLAQAKGDETWARFGHEMHISRDAQFLLAKVGSTWYPFRLVLQADGSLRRDSIGWHWTGSLTRLKERMIQETGPRLQTVQPVHRHPSLAEILEGIAPIDEH